LTAQGKATAMFIGCLPYGITLMTYVATPGYIVPFLNHPIARLVMFGLVCWEAVGFWILMKLTTFEV
jgi:tight adherence protein B